MSTEVKKKFFKKEYGMFFVLIGMVIISTIASPKFLNLNNILNILNQNATYGIMAIGMTLVIILGNIDLSVGSVVGLTGVIATPILRDYGFVPGVLAALSVGAIIGLINGLLITKLKINNFITTLGTMTICRGAIYIITNGFPVTGVPVEFNFIGLGRICGIPVAAAIWLIMVVVMTIILKFTKFGQYVYAIGGNDQAAWLSGIKTDKIKVITFVLCGVLASLGGLILNLKVLIAETLAGNGYELNVIASCVVGGISMDGGSGSVVGSVIGTLILGMILNILQLTGVSTFWVQAVTGLIILVAVGIDSVSNKKRD